MSFFSFFIIDLLAGLLADLTNLWSYALRLTLRLVMVIFALLAFAVCVFVVFAGLLGVTANFFLHRASRHVLYGLVTTYVAGPGAPEWVVAKKRNIVVLPIPRDVTTLSFKMHGEQRQKVIAYAREATRAKLTEIISDGERAA